METKKRIAIDVINDKIVAGDHFSYDSVCKEIVEKGGILRVSIGVTIGMYLKNLVRLKILSFDQKEGIFWSETGKIF